MIFLNLRLQVKHSLEREGAKHIETIVVAEDRGNPSKYSQVTVIIELKVGDLHYFLMKYLFGENRHLNLQIQHSGKRTT